MLFKLSMSGLKSKQKDYIVLLVGLVMSISIFYMFQTLALNKAFLEANSMIDSIEFVFQTGSVLLAILTFFYILYANSFLLSLRQKEFGMYMMLGAKKYKVALFMFMETIAIGTASLVIGTIAGVGLAQGIGQLLMKQLDFSGEGYIGFYVPSLVMTCIFFFSIFVLSALINSVKLSRISVLQLVHADAHVKGAVMKGKVNVAVACFSIILLGIGYASMMTLDKLKESGIMIAMLCTTGGTYMLFASVLPLLIKKLQGNKKYREKGINAFTLAQLNFRINQLAKVLATVAMLVALGAGAISGGMAFKNNVIKSTERFEIYDTVIYSPTAEEMNILNSIPFNEKNEYRYKVDNQFIYYVKEDLEKNRPLIHDEQDIGKVKRVSENLPAGAVSNDHQENNVNNKKIIPDEWDTALRSLQPAYLNYLDKQIKIVDLHMYPHIKGKKGIVFFGKTDDFAAHIREWKKLDQLQLDKYEHIKAEDILSKYKIYDEFSAVASGTVFMGFFLGIAFLAMLASCLMFKILSGATTDIKRYEMLRKMGVCSKLLTKSIYKELFLVFLIPAIVGIAHVLFGIKIFGFIVIDPYFRIWTPIVIFLIIYSAYYFLTVQLYKGIVLPKEG
ncbi:FtsX-like permease family protein [Siminovitchia sp. 179-K 8D1 HS]|uniref:FtsX-like permease family protein n=1 Tax=Siminovitchia sp. 179-K 8D1 HS TaxID=3142385 RepID=UPI0039A21BAA